jgi:Putative Ig domain
MIKLKLLYLSVLSLIVPCLSNAQGFAPNFPPINSILTWEGQYDKPITSNPEKVGSYQDYGEIEVQSSTEFSNGYYEYKKTGLNTATLNFWGRDKKNGIILINFNSLNSGTYTSSGTYQSYIGISRVPVELTYKASGKFKFSFLTILFGTAPRLKVGTNYFQKLKAKGGNPPYVWSITRGKLPSGLTLEKTGRISGSAKKVGRATFTIKVTDREKTTATQELTLRSYKL